MTSTGRELELRDVLDILWRRWMLLAAVTILVAAAFVAYAFLKTPIYRGAVVMVDASSSRDGGLLGRGLASLGGLASLTGINLSGANQQGEEALAVLRSRDFTERFITDHNLMPELFSKQWNPRTKSWEGPRESWPTLAQAAKFFDQNVRAVVRDKLTGLITLEVEWRDRDHAAFWANEMVARLNAEMRKRTIDHTERTVRFLNDELAKTQTVETREAIARLVEAQVNERMLATVTSEYVFRVVDKALPADKRDIVKPRKALLILLGPIVGFILGAAIIFLMATLRRERAVVS
jgi:uncharacterized protein involved in exopolysaccharide biosynthesis